MPNHSADRADAMEIPAEHRQAQLRKVREAQDQARKAVVAAKQTPGSVRRDDLVQARAHVQGFILAIEPMLRDADRFRKADFYREEVPLGMVKTENDRVPVAGLLAIVERDGVRATKTVECAGRSGGTKTETAFVPYSMLILTNALREGGQFLQINKLGVTLEEGEIDVQADVI